MTILNEQKVSQVLTSLTEQWTNKRLYKGESTLTNQSNPYEWPNYIYNMCQSPVFPAGLDSLQNIQMKKYLNYIPHSSLFTKGRPEQIKSQSSAEAKAWQLTMSEISLWVKCSGKYVIWRKGTDLAETSQHSSQRLTSQTKLEPQRKEKNQGTVEIDTLKEIDNHSPMKTRKQVSVCWHLAGLTQTPMDCLREKISRCKTTISQNVKRRQGPTWMQK